MTTKPITQEAFNAAVPLGSLCRTVAWSVETVHGNRHSFLYYACWVNDLRRWFLTGPADWYCTRDGLTTDQLIDLLNSTEGLCFVVANRDGWQDIK